MYEQLIKKTSSWLRLDADYVFKGGFLMVVSTVVAFAVTFLLAVVFANFVDPSIYGYYKYVIAIITLLSALNFSSIPSVLPRSVAQGFEGTYRHLSRVYAAWSIPSMLIALGIAVYYWWSGNTILASSIAIAGLISPLFRSLDFYGSFLQGKQAFGDLVLMRFFYSIVPSATLIGTLFFTDSVPLIVAAYFVSGLLTNAAITVFVFKKYQPNTEVDDTAQNFIGHTSIMNFMGIMSTQLDKILIFQFVGAAQVAMYAIASAIPMQFQTISKGIRTILYPKMSVQSFAEIRMHINWRVLLLLVGVTILYVAYFFIAPYLFAVFFPVYADGGVLASQIFALVLFFYPTMPYQLALYVHSRKKELYVIKVTSTIAKLAALVILLPLFGFWGAVFAFLVSYLVEGIMYTWIFNVTLRHEQ